MIAIVDYGVGNVQAFLNVYRQVGAVARRASTTEDVLAAERLILPGVGAFDWTMSRLEASGLRPALDFVVRERRTPILGVCVGMQMMAKGSEEGDLAGLGWIDGYVRRLDNMDGALPLPHMGWNDVEPTCELDGGLFAGLDATRMYFLHSYAVVLGTGVQELATTVYGSRFTVALRQDNVYGIQCHPEKSHSWGVTVLQNFASL